MKRLWCLIGVHLRMHGDTSPGPGCLCYCARCGRSWRATYDGIEPSWQRIR